MPSERTNDEREPSPAAPEVAPSITYDHASPISRLSAELLTYVFELADAAFLLDFAPYVSAPSTCALSFTRVCRRWHLIAMQTSLLWTRMTIRSEANTKQSTKWTKRSGTRLLSIDVSIHAKGAGLTAVAAYGFLDCHFSRLEQLTLEIRDSPDDSLTLPWPEETQLKSLQLIETRISFPDICLLLRSSPLLENLHVSPGRGLRHCSPFLPSTPIEDIPNPTRLTSLYLDTPNIKDTELCRILSLCPHLEFLSLIFPRTLGTSYHELPPIELPALLVVSLPFALFSDRLLHHWHAPALRSTLLGQRLPCSELYIDFTYGTASRETYYSIDFADEGSLSINDLYFFLKYSRQIESLTIFNCDENLYPILSLICVPDLEGNFGLPRLRMLYVENCPWWTGDLMWFDARYAWTATPRPRPLECICIISCPGITGVNDARHLFEEFGTQFFYKNDDYQDDSGALSYEE